MMILALQFTDGVKWATRRFFVVDEEEEAQGGVISAAFALPCLATLFIRHANVCRREPSAR